MMKQDRYVKDALDQTVEYAQTHRLEFVCPELLLGHMLLQMPFVISMEDMDVYHPQIKEIHLTLKAYVDEMEQVPEGVDFQLTGTMQFNEMMNLALKIAMASESTELKVTHLVKAILELEESVAHQVLSEAVEGREAELLGALAFNYEDPEESGEEMMDENDELMGNEEERDEPWRQWVTCMNDHVSEHNPLIGRAEELERTLQVLCRKEKHNPLHVGEAGVGKTALVWGLAERLARHEVPERLKGYRIYELDLGGLLAGAQFRGDFEKRIKSIMEGLAREGKAIVYIDEIHNLVGAGQTGEGSMDATQMLRPYMERDDLRFIGSTTYQDYNRHMSKHRGLTRRFQQIDIPEPSAEETALILHGLQDRYEQYHHLHYAEGTMEYAVEMSQKHMSDRFLPDKAIDLIDEAGASVEMRGGRKVKREDIDRVLTKMCKINAEALKAQTNRTLKTLQKRMKAQIYGQDEAIARVVACVEMAKAGLLDDNKPMASLLFVGPTGVGKTEVAKVLAQELGIELVRFDMSEYTEKHTVAKLIGSPAGYVGYEDGGLLTDAVRKHPNCVLLLDEIEKAHSDIYNILLQVMDYARLTDNRGNKADFRNVILLMTSNAGAQYASQASVGFGEGVSAGEAMLAQVKKTFKPEFINRLSGTVVFHDMDRTMAGLILDKKLRQLEAKLQAKSVTLKLSAKAREWLLQKGFTRLYGAREMDRTLQQHLSPLLMREMLYGTLQKGGTAEVEVKDDLLIIRQDKPQKS